MSAKHIIALAALLGASAVVMGAFGAHAFKSILSATDLDTFETAVKYHMWHSLSILAIGCACLLKPSIQFKWAAKLFAIGIFLFSGSLYLLAFDAPSWLGPVTPIGGLCFIAGWVLLFIGAIKIEL